MAKNKKAQILTAIMCASTVACVYPAIPAYAETINIDGQEYEVQNNPTYSGDVWGNESSYVAIGNDGSISINTNGKNAFTVDMNGTITFVNNSMSIVEGDVSFGNGQVAVDRTGDFVAGGINEQKNYRFKVEGGTGNTTTDGYIQAVGNITSTTGNIQSTTGDVLSHSVELNKNISLNEVGENTRAITYSTIGGGTTSINSTLDELTRAPIWYASDGLIDNVTITSVKAVRECNNIVVKNSNINSDEFGWKSHHINIEDSTINSEYIFFDSSDVTINNLNFTGKYSFQYMENLTIDNSNLDTKDAFWHSKNVVVKNSLVKGEYLGWFSDGLTLINCKIIGTQPLCYCKNLKLINCTMEETDLSFEYSDVDADIKGNIMSIKNPKSGRIIADSIGEIIKEDSIMEDTCDIIIRNS